MTLLKPFCLRERLPLRRASCLRYRHAGRLLRKIKEVGLSGQMYDFVKAFLRERFRLDGRALSNSQRLDMGVPQGSVIAPLFSIMLYDINKIRCYYYTVC